MQHAEVVTETIELTTEEVKDFLAFIEDKEEYLETGLGAFHTDNHGNW